MIRNFTVVVLVTLAISINCFVVEANSDGPYVFEGKENRRVVWVCDDTVNTKMVDLSFPQIVNTCGRDVTLWSSEFGEANTLEFQGEFNVAAVSDIHGQHKLFMTLLTNNGIVNKNGKWNFGNGHLVITGDIFDRGPEVTEALWFLYDLERQAEQAGGKMHLLLGNHEVMVMNGDLRYLHPKYIETTQQLKMAYEELFTKDAVLGRWLRSRPVLVKVNGMLFAHGGFHPELVDMKASSDEINMLFKRTLVKNELPKSREGLGKYLHEGKGPIWYRGYFRDKGATSSEIDRLLTHFDITHIIVGHTTQDHIKSFHDGRIIAIDAGMKNGAYGEMLLWKNHHFSRATLSGEIIALPKATSTGNSRMVQSTETIKR